MTRSTSLGYWRPVNDGRASAFGFGDASIYLNGTQISVDDGDRLDLISVVGGDISLTESSISLVAGISNW